MWRFVFDFWVFGFLFSIGEDRPELSFSFWAIDGFWIVLHHCYSSDDQYVRFGEFIPHNGTAFAID
jgi:hypothetical protein